MAARLNEDVAEALKGLSCEEALSCVKLVERMENMGASEAHVIDVMMSLNGMSASAAKALMGLSREEALCYAKMVHRMENMGAHEARALDAAAAVDNNSVVLSSGRRMGKMHLGEFFSTAKRSLSGANQAAGSIA